MLHDGSFLMDLINGDVVVRVLLIWAVSLGGVRKISGVASHELGLGDCELSIVLLIDESSEEIGLVMFSDFETSDSTRRVEGIWMLQG